MPTLLDAALFYAAKGFRVLPVHWPVEGGCSCGVEDCASPCKHPLVGHGKDDATLDTAQIRSWWARWPEANVGLRMGGGVVALDVDAHKGGNETLLSHEPITGTPEVRTPKGGSHLYLAADDGGLLNAVEKLPGLDLRTDRGYVLAPPSRTLEGAYKWVHKLNGHFAECPAWVRAAFSQDAQQSSAPAVAKEAIPQGQRDDALFRVGCRMRYAGAGYEEILVAMTVFNRTRCKPPMTDAQVEKLARQAAKYEPGGALPNAEDRQADGFPEGVFVGAIGEISGEYRNTGLPTGIRFIDENCTCGGLKDGEVAVFSASTGAGKTGLLLQVVEYALGQGVAVCYGTFADTSATGIRDRLLIMRTGWKGAEPPGDPRLREEWLEAKAEIEKLPLYIWDATKGRGGRKVDPFLEWCTGKSPGLIVGDYAQKLKSDRARSPMEHAEDACDALALTANRLDIPIVLGSQLTLGNKKEGREDMTRGSQEWEHAAGFHMKIRVFKEDEALKLDYPFSTISGISEWTIAKNRFTVEFPPHRKAFARWDVKHIRFEELS